MITTNMGLGGDFYVQKQLVDSPGLLLGFMLPVMVKLVQQALTMTGLNILKMGLQKK